MERTRLRRSKSAATIEGNAHNPKCKSVSKESDSYSRSDGFTKGNTLLDNSLNGACGKPIKKLLAEEMTKESDAKRRSPSIIARLMGLDGLPSPQRGHRQQRKASDKRQENNASITIHHSELAAGGLSIRRSSVDQQVFKDVYEDLEASHVSNHRHSSTWVSDSRKKRSSLEPIEQNTKHLLSCERLQGSKESEETLETHNFDKKLQYRYLQQPDSLFIGHLHDFTPFNSFYGHVASSQPSNLVEHVGTAEVWKNRGYECRLDVSSCRKREDGFLLLSHNRHKSCQSCHSMENRYKAEAEKDVLPTKIVVLKPNLGKAGNYGAPVLSPGSSDTHPSSFKKHLEWTRAKADEAKKRTKKNSSDGLSFSKAKYREDRELARAITRQMRESLGPFGHDLIISAHSGLRGYAGDESSCDAYESDSSSGVEGMNISSRNSLDGINCFKSSPFGPSESSASKEAKKHLSERWKMTQRCQGLQPIGKVSTLGDMLGVPDRVARHERLDAAVSAASSTENSVGRGYCKHWDGPLGISSKNGWKDGCVRPSFGSQSFPCSLYGSRDYNTIGQNEAPIDDLMTVEKTNRGRSKARKGNLRQKEDNAPKIIKTSTKNPHPCCRKYNDGSKSFLDVNFNQIQTDVSSNKHGEEEKLLLLPEGPAIPNTCLGSDVTFENATSSCNQSENIVQDHNSCADDQDVVLQEPLVCQSDEGSTSLLCVGPEPECLENFKEADNPSPVSVLGVSFAEDLSSSSDCFETVNAELHELRMQLQLLKMESGNNVETPALFSSGEDVVQQSESLSDEKCIFRGDNWKSAYIEDVLINSGLEAIDQDAFFAAWHSPNCPVDPWVFDIVEKQHWEDVTVTKLERKLLFDWMNSVLLEAFQEFVDPRPWVRPIWGGLVRKWLSQGVKDALHKFLVEQEKGSNRDEQEKELDREMNWLRLEDGIDVIGKEIEELLVEDLVGEVIA